MLEKKIRIMVFFILGLINFFSINVVKSDNLNECIKKAISKKIVLNKILTLCRENINPVNIYSNIGKIGMINTELKNGKSTT